MTWVLISILATVVVVTIGLIITADRRSADLGPPARLPERRADHLTGAVGSPAHPQTEEEGAWRA